MTIDLPDNLDLNNAEFQNLWNLVQHTRQSVFLTGKAGTGKSTFLKYICANTKKKYVVLAPTGIAAVNVGGQTLHSFFKIPFKPLLPDDPDFSPRQIRKTLRYPKEKVTLIRQLDLIIIDEISMVRADIIDFVDKVLRCYSGNQRMPFGGKQLLLVGDIFQLEPVVTRDMREILRRYYQQFYFFNARAFQVLGLVPIELCKIYRQTDDQFVALLDRIRVNHASRIDIAQLNSRCNPNYQSNDDDFAITLATRRDTVDSINDEHMAALKTKEFVFEGKIEGNFPENDLPTARVLTLKEGAQVIFIRNDRENRWVNGTIGKISLLDDDKVCVALEDGVEYELEPDVWENIQYTFNEEKNVVEENILGTFVQYPIKPAWALTVHKSQGLTFNKVVIDFAGGAFTSGQTYVALSRCTSLEGITLLKPLSERDIIVSTAVVDFSRQFNNHQLIQEALALEEAYRLYRRANHALDHNEFATCLECFAQAQRLHDVLQSPLVRRFIAIKCARFSTLAQEKETLRQVILRQYETLRSLADEYASMGRQSLEMGSDDIAIRSAMANFDKALRIHPQNVAARVGKGLLFLRLDEADKARDEIQTALAADKNNYEAHMAMAQVHVALKDTPEAIKSYKRAARADKKRPEPHEALGSIYEKIGLDDLADEQFDMARRLRKPKKRKKN
ncbi:MAG: AAA family ATPase [Muribaculaceae bacterium]|nr:AAA family ATPase [Muribaculaceae bacterium]